MSPTWTPKLRLSILERDGYTCQKCGAKDQSLQVHHIDSDFNNNDSSNLTTLCKECHIHLPHKPPPISNTGPFAGIRSSTKEGKKAYMKIYNRFFRKRIRVAWLNIMLGDILTTPLEYQHLAFTLTYTDRTRWFFHQSLVISRVM